MIRIETSRLILRNFTSGDWQGLQELAVQYQASEWARYEEPWPTSTEKIKGMANWFASGDSYLAVCLQETGVLIGLIAIDQRLDQPGKVQNLGYVFRPDYHGRGYAAEGCQAAVDYLFGRLVADRISTGTHTENKASIRLLKRLGLKETEPGDFHLSREEWQGSGRGSAPRSE